MVGESFAEKKVKRLVEEMRKGMILNSHWGNIYHIAKDYHTGSFMMGTILWKKKNLKEARTWKNRSNRNTDAYNSSQKMAQ